MASILPFCPSVDIKYQQISILSCCSLARGFSLPRRKVTPYFLVHEGPAQPTSVFSTTFILSYRWATLGLISFLLLSTTMWAHTSMCSPGCLTLPFLPMSFYLESLAPLTLPYPSSLHCHLLLVMF